jgi:hypothetical protein
MSIFKKQNLSENIELLAAQRNLYSRAKNIIGVQMIISLPISICIVIITILKPELKGYAAIWGIMVLILDLFVLTPWVKELQDNAARIQELFDTKVLGLNWSELSVGKRPEPELIHEEASKHGLTESKIANLKGWYPSVILDLPDIFAILISQRANVWWDAKLRRRYTLGIKIVLVLLAISLIGYGINIKVDMFDFLSLIVAPLLPTYFFGYRQMKQHDDAADKLDKLRELCEKLWVDAIKGEGKKTLLVKCRTLQDQIFEHRLKNPPVFDFIFKLLRDKNEMLMNKGAEALASEVNTKK